MKSSAHPAALETTEIRRHYHVQPYATLVLDGGYEEAGDQGRFQVRAGDVLLHPAFSAHRDRVGRTRTFVLDLPLPMEGRSWPGLARLVDPDLVIRVAAVDAREAQSLLVEGLTRVVVERSDPADRLADALSVDPSTQIGGWAANNGFSREWLSRRFKRLFGVDSAMFRVEARARLAWRQIVATEQPLAQIAVACGFADQSHMTRAIGRLTGRSPRLWRPVTLVQEGDRDSR
ncbi:MAG: helix-turn-helix domain-containing protein [Sphingomicrobium sp.]